MRRGGGESREGGGDGVARGLRAVDAKAGSASAGGAGDAGAGGADAKAGQANGAARVPRKRRTKATAAEAPASPERPRRGRRGAGEGGPPRRSFLGRIVRGLVRRGLKLGAWAVVGVVALVAVFRVVPLPAGPYMVAEWLRLGSIERDWTPLEAISPDLARAVVAAEDARFCAHRGIDWAAVQAAVEDWQERGRLRGGSTITQQTAKNAFLWHGRSMARKGLEAVFAGLIELLWGKRRVLEVYLNLAEFGEGVFGAEAAARHHFGVSARELTLRQAARLAVVLPNPKERDPARLSGRLAGRADRVVQGVETIRARGDDACFLG